MALLNIGASNRDDAFYRYKMPRLLTKIEGRGNGIKTNVVNMVDVAKALARSPAYTTKYFGCELGAQSKFDEKTGTSIVNGAHDTTKLAALLENFIKKYVQCYGCGNPETDINITKTQHINLKCQACGFISDVDMRDKLTTYILKNPPEQKKGGKKERNLRKAEKERMDQGELADEEAKKLKKDQRKKKGVDDEKKVPKKKANGNGSDEEVSPAASVVDEVEDVIVDDDDGVEWQTDTSAAAAKQRIMEQLTTATSEMVMLTIPEKAETSPRVKTPRTPKEKETKPKLLKKLSSKKSEAPVEAIDEKKALEAPKVEMLSAHEKLVEEFRNCLQTGYSAAHVADYYQSKCDSYEELFTALFEALFGGLSKGLSKEMQKKKAYLAKVVQEEGHQKVFLDVLENHCCTVASDLGTEVAVLLKVLYDEDILDEDHIISWFDGGATKPKSAHVRKSAEPFVAWLREAESEEED